MGQWEAEESAGTVCYLLIAIGIIVKNWWVVVFAVAVVTLIVWARKKRNAIGPMEELRLYRESSAKGFADHTDRMIEAAADLDGRIG